MLPLHQLGYPKPTDGSNFGGHSNGTNAIAGVRAGAKSESANKSSDQVLSPHRGRRMAQILRTNKKIIQRILQPGVGRQWKTGRITK